MSQMAPNITKKKFMAKPVHINRRAFLYPHTSHTQSLMIYDTGNTIKPPVKLIEPNAICFVSNTFAAIKQTQKSMLKSMNSTLTLLSLLFIILVFKEVYQALYSFFRLQRYYFFRVLFAYLKFFINIVNWWTNNNRRV